MIRKINLRKFLKTFEELVKKSNLNQMAVTEMCDDVTKYMQENEINPKGLKLYIQKKFCIISILEVAGKFRQKTLAKSENLKVDDRIVSAEMNDNPAWIVIQNGMDIVVLVSN